MPWSSLDERHLVPTSDASRWHTFVTVGLSDMPAKGYRFDKISPGWTKFSVTDWVVNKDIYSDKAALSLTIPCLTGDVLTKEQSKGFIFY